jgi:hypothetical protein
MRIPFLLACPLTKRLKREHNRPGKVVLDRTDFAGFVITEAVG